MGNGGTNVTQVKFCSDLDIPFLATGGGHGFATTFRNLKNGIEIDLGFFRSVSVDATANTMTIGGGTHFQDVFDPLFKEGKEIRECLAFYSLSECCY